MRSGKVRGGEQYVVGSVSSTDTISMFRIKSWQVRQQMAGRSGMGEVVAESAR